MIPSRYLNYDVFYLILRMAGEIECAEQKYNIFIEHLIKNTIFHYNYFINHDMNERNGGYFNFKLNLNYFNSIYFKSFYYIDMSPVDLPDNLDPNTIVSRNNIVVDGKIVDYYDFTIKGITDIFLEKKLYPHLSRFLTNTNDKNILKILESCDKCDHKNYTWINRYRDG